MRLLILILLTGCASLNMECNNVKVMDAEVLDTINRCENREVVCYSSNGNSLQCKFKER